MIEQIWRFLFFRTHATAVGAITALALAAIDTALWDLRCRSAGLPLHVMAGGAQARVPLYTTEGGWLQLATEELVEQALRSARARLRRLQGQGRQAACQRGRGPARGGARGGRRRLRDHDRRQPGLHGRRGDPPGARLRAVRPRLVRGAAAGRGPRRPCAPRRQRPALPDRGRRDRSTACRISASICSATPARSSRSTSPGSAASRPGSRCAHLAEAFNIAVCPHFLMELHVGADRRRAERPLGRVHPAARRHHAARHADRGRPRDPVRGAGPRHRLGHGGDRAAPGPRADAPCGLRAAILTSRNPKCRRHLGANEGRPRSGAGLGRERWQADRRHADRGAGAHALPLRADPLGHAPPPAADPALPRGGVGSRPDLDA